MFQLGTESDIFIPPLDSLMSYTASDNSEALSMISSNLYSLFVYIIFSAEPVRYMLVPQLYHP